jgi:hypothetical protein
LNEDIKILFQDKIQTKMAPVTGPCDKIIASDNIPDYLPLWNCSILLLKGSFLVVRASSKSLSFEPYNSLIALLFRVILIAHISSSPGRKKKQVFINRAPPEKPKNYLY